MLKIVLKKYKADAKKQSSLAHKLLNEKKSDFPYYSVSHKYSDGYVYVLVVLSFNAIGADLEILIKKDKVLLDFFNNEEYEILGAKNWDNFYSLWTAKEAVIKLLGAKTDLRNYINLQKLTGQVSASLQLMDTGFAMDKNRICNLKTNFNGEKIFVSIFQKSNCIVAVALKDD